MHCSLITCSICQEKISHFQTGKICIYNMHIHRWRKKRGHLGHEFTRRRARSWCPRLSSWTASDRACEQRTWRWFLSMAIRVMVRLASVLIFGVFEFLLSRKSSFLPMFPLCGALKQNSQETPKMLPPPPQQTSHWLVSYLCEMWGSRLWVTFHLWRSFCRTFLPINPNKDTCWLSRPDGQGQDLGACADFGSKLLSSNTLWCYSLLWGRSIWAFAPVLNDLLAFASGRRDWFLRISRSAHKVVRVPLLIRKLWKFFLPFTF